MAYQKTAVTPLLMHQSHVTLYCAKWMISWELLSVIVIKLSTPAKYKQCFDDLEKTEEIMSR